VRECVLRLCPIFVGRNQVVAGSFCGRQRASLYVSVVVNAPHLKSLWALLRLVASLCGC
jgi:hypothetical protein